MGVDNKSWHRFNTLTHNLCAVICSLALVIFIITAYITSSVSSNAQTQIMCSCIKTMPRFIITAHK
jgi:hypothetical protein